MKRLIFLPILSIAFSVSGWAQDANTRNLNWITAKVICDEQHNLIGTATVIGYEHKTVGEGTASVVEGDIYLVTAWHLNHGKSPGCAKETDLGIQFARVAGRPDPPAELHPLVHDKNSKLEFEDLDVQVLVIHSSDDFSIREMDRFFKSTESQSCWCVISNRAESDEFAVMAYPPEEQESQTLTRYAQLTFLGMDQTKQFIRFRAGKKLPPGGSSGAPVVGSDGGIVGFELSSESNAIGRAVDLKVIQSKIPSSVPWQLGQVASQNSEATLSISAGWTHACRLTKDGAVYCWGSNSHGQLGVTGSVQSLQPQQVQGGHLFREIAVGYDHTCAIEDKSNDAYCWGNNDLDQLGIKNLPQSDSPIKVPVQWKGGWASITAGEQFTCGIKADSHAVCWGRDYAYPMGFHNTMVSEIPQLSFLQISAGTSHVCGLVIGGGVHCWGYRWTSEPSSLPKQVNTNGVAFTPGTLSSSKDNSGACAVADQREMYCWEDYNDTPSLRVTGVVRGTIGFEKQYLVSPASGALHAFVSGIKEPHEIYPGALQVSVGKTFGCFVDPCGHPFCWSKDVSAPVGSGRQPDGTPQRLARDVKSVGGAK